MPLTATVNEQHVVTAQEVAAAGGAHPEDLTYMKFEAAQGAIVPGLALAGGTAIRGTELRGVPTAAGTYTLTADLIQGGNSYARYSADLVVLGSEPDPEEPTPGDPATRHPLSNRLAAYLGRPGDETFLALADAHIPIVEAFVHGYTRGRGFDDDAQAVGPLQAVIVSAAARLTANPEQVANYTMGDYSEKSAVLNGWTLPEQAVLHRYRRRTSRGPYAPEPGVTS